MDRYLFTSGGHRTRPPGLSMSAYVERDAFHGPWEHQGKVITLAAAFDSAAGFHDVILKPNWTMVHSNQRPWVDNEEFRTYEPVRVNHYGRSFEECMTKFQTGRLSADHWRVQFGAQLCREAMEGEPGYDKHRTSMDTTLQALGFPDVVRAMLRLVD